MYESRRIRYRNVSVAEKQRKRGRVKIWVMKSHTLLKVVSSLQVQRWHLRVYVKIDKTEQGKFKRWSSDVRRSRRIHKFVRY